MKARTLLLALAPLWIGCRAAPPDTLYVLADVEAESIDPHASGGRYASQTVLLNTYEGLVARDADLRLRPALAASWSNPDDHTWEFVLRAGVRFHDGSALSAADVVDSFRRAQEHPHSAVRGDLANLAEVTTPAPGVVRLRTREPDASLLAVLPGIFVMSGARARHGAVVQEGSFGTGAYRVGSWRKGEALVLERFEACWAGPAALARVHLLPFAYGSPQAGRRLPAGAALAFYAAPGSAEFERASREQTLHERTGLAVQYLGFDLRERDSPGVTLPAGAHGNPFRDLRVRQAVALALDYARLRASVLGGRARPATQMVSPEAVGYDPSLPEPRQDLARARALMARSAVPTGFEVELDLREFVGSTFAPHLVDGLATLGIKAKLRTFADQAFFDHLRAGRSSLYLLRYSCRTGDAQEVLDRLLHSREEARGYGALNFSYDASPAPGLDALIEEARHTVDTTRRLERLQAAMHGAIEQQLVVPLVAEPTINFLSPRLAWRPRADGYRVFAEMQPVR